MRQPFLLDTCVALWMVADELPKATAGALTGAYNAGFQTYVSPVTAWEVGNLARKRRFRSHYTPHQWFERLMSQPGMARVGLTAEVMMESSFLPGVMNDDPADRIIAATAREYGFTVMTRDKALLDYGAQGYLSVLEC
jgi:PIN domain nuclease of toxin-antitoxin system